MLEADKGKRFVVVDQSTYLAMAADHTIKDKPATQAEVRSTQRTLSSTAKAMVNMFGVGRDVGYRNYSRSFDNAGSEAEDAPMVKILPKMHKPPTSQGHPESRPVVTAQTGILSRAGDVLADFIGPIILVNTPRLEDQSTEEVLYQLEEAQRSIVESGTVDAMVGSLDVKSLYPSLDQDHAAELVSQLVLESKASLKGVNYRCVQTFIASNLTEKEVEDQGLQHLLPEQLHKKGRKPGPTTPELSCKITDDQKEPPWSKWEPTNPDRDLSDTQKRQLLAKAVKIAVKVVFGNHVYQLCGVLYLQLAGGPIGLRLTSIVARVVMDKWYSLFLVKLDSAGWRLWASVKYKDDVNVVAEVMDKDMEWGELSKVSPKEEMLEIESKEAHSMRLICEAADSIL